MLVHPFTDLSQVLPAALHIGGLGFSGSGEDFHFAGTAIQLDQLQNLAVRLQGEIHLVLLATGDLLRAAEGRHDINPEILLRLGGGTVMAQAQEQITATEDILVTPVHVVLENVEARYILLSILIIERGHHDIEEVAIQCVVTQEVGLLLNLLIVVDVLLQVEIILAVVTVELDELTGHCVHDILHDSVDGTQQEILLHDGHGDIQTQVILQCLLRDAQLGIQGAGGQAMHTQRIDDLQSNGPICGLREIAGDDGLQHSGLGEHFMHSRIGTQGRILLDALPVCIEADDAWSIIGNLLVNDRTDGFRDGFQHFAFLNGHDVLERIDVCRVDREHIHVIFQPGCHILVQRAEFLQVFPDHGFLLGRLPQDALLGDIGDILGADQHLLKAILHLQQ